MVNARRPGYPHSFSTKWFEFSGIREGVVALVLWGGGIATLRCASSRGVSWPRHWLVKLPVGCLSVAWLDVYWYTGLAKSRFSLSMERLHFSERPVPRLICLINLGYVRAANKVDYLRSYPPSWVCEPAGLTMHVVRHSFGILSWLRRSAKIATTQGPRWSECGRSTRFYLWVGLTAG